MIHFCDSCRETINLELDEEMIVMEGLAYCPACWEYEMEG